MRPEDSICERRAYLFGVEFLPAVEDLYRRESISEGAKNVAFNMKLGCFLCSTFLLSDYLLTGPDFFLYVIGRVFCVTPLCLCIVYFALKKDRFYQLLISSYPLAISLTQSVLIFVGHGNYRVSYLFGEIIVCICGFVITRPRLPYALVSILLQGIVYFATLFLADVDVGGSRVVGTLYGLSGCAVTIMIAYALEGVSRRAFLLNLRVQRLNQELERMAMTDPLTGLGNRRRLDDATRRFWSRPTTDIALASLILIDVDRFKSFNDTYGHAAGDLCLTTIARCVAANSRDTDLAVRFGGEEIVVFLPDTDFTEARQIAEIIRLAIIDTAVPHPVVAPDAVVTASFGVATVPTAESTPAELINRADIALYAAKHAGRNQVWPPLSASHPDACQISQLSQAS